MLGHNWHASERPFKWRLAGRPIIAQLYWYWDHSSPHQQKKVVKVGPPLTKLSGSADESIL